MKQEVFSPTQLGLQYKELLLKTSDNVQLHGWHLPAQGKSQGTIVFFHGNAENITTHIASIYWLPPQGYEVFTFDYRGYGKSNGEPTVDGVILDAVTVLEYVTNTLDRQNVVVLGQSLGCVVALNAVAQLEDRSHLKAVAVDSCFSGFREIAREKLSNLWITWPLQYPLSYAFTSSHNPLTLIEFLSPIPTLVIHGNADHIIPMHHGVRLFESALPPKYFWEIERGRHIDSLGRVAVRNKFTGFIRSSVQGTLSMSTKEIIKIDSPSIFSQKQSDRAE